MFEGPKLFKNIGKYRRNVVGQMYRSQLAESMNSRKNPTGSPASAPKERSAVKAAGRSGIRALDMLSCSFLLGFPLCENLQEEEIGGEQISGLD